MRRLFSVIGLPLVALLLIGANTTNPGRHEGHHDVYFGFLLGVDRLAGVAIDLGAPDTQGQRALRAYVCDGFGPPEGMAVWFTGPVTTPPGATPLIVPSVTGRERLTMTAVNDRGVYGTFTDAAGTVAHFVAYTAIDGAGIYEVTLDESLHYTGVSTDGARLDAQASPNGTTTGTIKAPGGKAISFTVRSLALASPADLLAHGLSTDYTKYVANNQVPGEYVAVIAPGGSHWFGRSGAVRVGSPGAEIIGLDKKE
jgi:hypothetical protein